MSDRKAEEVVSALREEMKEFVAEEILSNRSASKNISLRSHDTNSLPSKSGDQSRELKTQNATELQVKKAETIDLATLLFKTRYD